MLSRFHLLVQPGHTLIDPLIASIEEIDGDSFPARMAVASAVAALQCKAVQPVRRTDRPGPV